MNESSDETILYSPYVAAYSDKDEVGQREFFERFYRLPAETKDFITSPQTAEYVKNLFDTEIAPDNYDTAIAKIVAFAAMGDVPVASIPQLLVKLGLSEQQAQKIATELERILEPVIAARGKAAAPQGMQEMPPLSRPTETGPQPIAGQQGNTRNIIDLRKQQPNA